MHTTEEGRFDAARQHVIRRSRGTTIWGAVVAAVVAVGALSAPVAATADTAPAAGTPETVTADALPTVQIDGVVYAQEVVGNTVYVGGNFTKARPAGAAPGTNETPRANLLAYNLTTGELISSWNPGANNTVLDIKKSADGSRIYVAGMFSQAAGAWRYRVAAFDTATGALIKDWAPATNGRVDGLAVTENTVYLAGEFTTVNSTQRTKVAAVSTTTGALTAFTADVQGGYGAKDVVVSPDRTKVVIAGSFTSVNGSTNPGRGITALDATTGTTKPWAMNSVLSNGGTAAAMYSLASDGDSVYGTGMSWGGKRPESGFEGAFRANWSDGSLVWMEDCHGDTYDITATADTVYVAGHPHSCANIGGFPQQWPSIIRHSLAFSKAPTGQLITADTEGFSSWAGEQAPTPLHWYPEYVPGTHTGQNQGPWQTLASGDYLLAGGEFLKVNGAAQQGLVRFAKKNVAPNKQGPRIQGGAWALSATVTATGNRVSWSTNHDRDNTTLKYQVFRQDKGMSTPLYEASQSSTFWSPTEMSYRDTTVVPGTSYKYRVKATDASGNTTQTDWKAATAPASSVEPPTDRPLQAGSKVAFTYKTDAANATNWAVVYPKGRLPVAKTYGYVAWAYTPAASGTVELTMPATPGDYTVWLLKADGYERLSAGEDFTVVPANAVTPPATVVPPAANTPAPPVTPPAAVTPPVAVAPAPPVTPPAAVTPPAPVAPAPVVPPAPAAPATSTVTPPASMNAGTAARIGYTTPSADPSNWIGVYAVGQVPAGAVPALVWGYAPGASGTVSIRMPWTPGTYEIWYLHKGAYTPLGTPVTVTVR